MAWYPGAIRKEVTKHRRPMQVTNRAFITHVAVSEAASLYGYFSGAAVASHFYVRKDGTVEQYVDTRYIAPANLDANRSAYSVETQGGVTDPQGEPWTPQQVDSLAALSKWLHDTHGVPLQTMQNSLASSKGIGWHRLGINPWRVAGGEVWSTSRGKICPGNAKIAQVGEIVRKAGGAVIPTTPSNPGTGSGVLKLGSSGAGVKELQELLNREYSAGLAVDSSFGPATQTAVRNYQASRGLIIDGVAGPDTLAALRSSKPALTVPVNKPTPSTPVLVLGNTGESVKTLQRTLNEKLPEYSRLVIDGAYGPATLAVVKEFQRRNGLQVDGAYGPKTRAALAAYSKAPAPTPTPPSGPAKLDVDGSLGPATIKRWQQVMGTPADGVISPKSSLIMAVQRHLVAKGYTVGKAGIDGDLGPSTIKALQRYLGTPVDGVISKPKSSAIIALQNRLNEGRF